MIRLHEERYDYCLYDDDMMASEEVLFSCLFPAYCSRLSCRGPLVLEGPMWSSLLLSGIQRFLDIALTVAHYLFVDTRSRALRHLVGRSVDKMERCERSAEYRR